MYEQVFNLTSRPFTSIHYVKHYFPAAAIDQSLQQTKMLVERGSGPVVVVGGHGTGKTLFLAILEECFKSKLRVVNISASLLRTREDLLQNILFQLQMNCRGLGENEMRLDLVEMLKKDQSSGILLMIDDAQKLSVESVEEMQLLTDFILEGQPRVRLVLAGSQGMEERLADTRLISFNQRIAGRFFLSNLTSTEVEQYVRAHLDRAGGQPDELFAPDSYRAIYEVTEGCPRYINQVCDHAMIFAATRGTIPVTDSLVREAWYDIQKLPGSVAPSGSGASMSDSPIAVQRVETDSEGWTVLEFGELSDSEVDSMQPVSDVVETPAAEVVAEPAAEVVAEPEEAFVGMPLDGSSDPGQPFVTDSVEQVAAAPVEQQPEPIPGPSFSVAPTGEVKATQVSSNETEQQSIATNAPSAMGGAAILASAMAGFGVAAASDPNAVSQDIEFSETASVTEPPSVEVLEPQISPQANPLAQNQTIATPQENVQSEPVSPPPVFEDPFAADDYENEEEVLANAYSPFVAQQNQRSLEVTSEQLKDLTPGDAVQWNESPSQLDSAPVAEESFPTFETAMAPPEPVRETQKPPVDPRETAVTRLENNLPGPESMSDEFVVNRDAAVVANEAASVIRNASSIDIEPVEANPGSGYVPLDPDATPVAATPEVPHLIDSNPLGTPNVDASIPAMAAEQPFVQPQTLPQQPPHVTAPSAPVPDVAVPQFSVPQVTVPETVPEPPAVADPDLISESSPKFHEQTASPEDPEIRRQAEDIIRSLEKSIGVAEIQVSHETQIPSISIQEETNAIEAVIQRSVESQPAPQADSVAPPASSVVMPNLDEIKNALRQAQDGQDYPTTPVSTQQLPVTSGKIPVQMAGVDPVAAEQEILSEVREQSSFVATNQPNASQPIAGQDDRAILEVNQNQQAVQPLAAVESQEAPMPAWSQQEPSQGEAARVDYQRLFDQLRNVQGNQE